MRARSQTVRFVAATVCLLAAAHSAEFACAAPTGFVDKILLDGDAEHRYVVYVPPDYDPTRLWPVVLYLHGAGFSGTDGRLQVAAGLAQVIRTEGNFPAIVVFPQCEETDAPLLMRWGADSPDGRRALLMLDQVEREYSVDTSRRVLTGWSMGGYGAWSLAAGAPDRWTRIVAVAGGGDPNLASQIAAPVWAIHGADDRAILPARSQQMVDAVNAAGGQAVVSVLEGVAHDAWREAYLSPTVRNWMLSARPAAVDTAALAQESEEILCSGRADAIDGEFRPALIIPRAIALHAGNEALRTLAYGVPAAADATLLSGELDNQTFDFTAVGEDFRVSLEDLGFEVTLQRVLIEPQASGVVKIRVGLQPLTITIGGTHVRSATRTADAGLTTIRIGDRHPVWIDFWLRPAVEDGHLRIHLDRVDFRIPDANWVVEAPQDVAVSGPDLTPDLAQTALVGGLYLRRSQIEEYIRNAMPGLVRNVEELLQPARIDRLVTSIWPLPVFRPRLQIRPEEVWVDEHGLSLVMNIAAAPFSTQPHPVQPRVTAPMGPHAAELGKGTGLEVGMSPAVVQSLSSMIVDAHAAHIDVRDMPEPEFKQFADRGVLTRILPALASLQPGTEVRTEFNLSAPLVVERSDVANAVQFTSADEEGSRTPAAQPVAVQSQIDVDSLAATFEIPQLEISTLTRDAATSRRWREYAHFNVRLTHQARLQLSSDAHHRRLARLMWNGDPEIQVVGGYVNGDAPRDAPVDRAELAARVRECWFAWTGHGAAVEEEVPDLVLGSARLRIESIDWRDQALLARFLTPQTRIINSGPRLVEYAVRGPFSGWSERRRLKPGGVDVYSSPSAMSVRRFPLPVDAAVELPVGGELDLSATDR